MLLGYYDEASNVGTVNNTTHGVLQSDNSIGLISLQDGDQGLNYNFGEIVPMS